MRKRHRADDITDDFARGGEADDVVHRMGRGLAADDRGYNRYLPNVDSLLSDGTPVSEV